jgi:starch synthase
VIHCQGWISHVLPLYLKKAYIDDPIFSNSKIVLSLYEDTPAESFPDDTKDKILFGAVSKEDVSILEDPTGINLAKLAASYADGVIFASENIDPELTRFCKDSGKVTLDYNAEAIKDGSYIDDYNSFYDKL